MTTSTWVVAWNYPTRAWSSGGSLDEYERPHWDLYVVAARGREEAARLGRAMRRKQQALPASQAAFLASLRKQHAPQQDCIREHGPWIRIELHELKAAAALEAKGLLIGDTLSPRDVRLNVSAFNLLPAVEALLAETSAC